MGVSLPPVPQRPFAAGDAEVGTKPVYRPSDDPLPFSRNARLAALDVMILVFAARLHIEHLNGIGKCQEDVAALIRRDLEAIHRLLNPEPPVFAPASPDRHEPPMPSPIPIPATKPRQQLGDVRPRLRLASTADEPTPSLFGPTRANVGETGANPGSRGPGARVAPPYGD